MMNIDMSSANDCRKKPILSWFEIFDPRSEFISKCNHLLLFIGVFNHYIDALILYIAVVNDSGVISLDLQLGISTSFLRLIGDFFLFLGMILRFRTGISYGDPTFPLSSGNKKLVKEPRIIAINYLKSSFIIDLLAALPLPQAYIWYCIVALRTYQARDVYFHLYWIAGIQFYPRLLWTAIIYRKIEKLSLTAIRNPWGGTFYILFLYGMLSHYLGATFYLMYIDEILYCRDMVFSKEANATMHELDRIAVNCTQKDESMRGLTSDAFANNIGSRSFSQKYMFCFSWGLKTLSSMGQNLTPNAYIVDSIANIVVVMLGLFVFADLIARMQSVDEPEQQHIIRQRELEEWTNFHQLPPHLKKRIMETVQIHFNATKSVDGEAMLDSLPRNLSCEVRRHLYLELIRKLPVFDEMDDQLLHAICGYVMTYTGTEGRFIALQGEPVQQLLFIFTGQVEISSIDGQFSSCLTVGTGGLCGQELLAWSSLPGTSTHNLPSSTCTVKCLTDVEAFSLLAKDLKLLAINFNYDQYFFDALLRHSSKDIVCMASAMDTGSC